MKEKRNGKITKNGRFMERLLTALLVLILGMTVSAAEGVSGRGFRIPDDNFRVFCIEKGYADADGYIIPVKAASVTTLDVSRKRISSLEGIGYFTGLTELYCNDNSLKKLEVSECKELTQLVCHYNRLKALDVSEVLKTAVYILYCGNQQDEQGNSRTLTLTLTRRQELLWKKMLADEYKANTFNAKVNLNVKHI